MAIEESFVINGQYTLQSKPEAFNFAGTSMKKHVNVKTRLKENVS